MRCLSLGKLSQNSDHVKLRLPCCRWDQGLVGMRVGDKRKLTIPPQMAYGPKGIPNVIPGNSTLLFDVELVDVK